MSTAHFTFAYWCLLVAALLPLGCALLAKSGYMSIPRSKGGFDNIDPRAWLARQEGWRARANAAQANSFEGLPFFLAAVVIAHQLGARQSLVDLLALAYVVLRLVFIALYVGGSGTARSVVWGLALAVNIAILFAGYR